MVWMHTGAASPGGINDEDIRCGTVRPSMMTNPLLAKGELGKVKPILFNNPAPGKVFG